MTRDEADTKLRVSLNEVVRKLTAKDDDWQYSMLRTFREYCRAIGIERPLIDPIQVMIFEVADSIFHERGEKGSTKPSGYTSSLAYAAAAIESLNHHHRYRAADAITKVAKVSGFDKKKLSSFRNQLSSSRAPKNAPSAYDMAFAEMRDWSDQTILEAVTDIGTFFVE